MHVYLVVEEHIVEINHFTLATSLTMIKSYVKDQVVGIAIEDTIKFFYFDYLKKQKSNNPFKYY